MRTALLATLALVALAQTTLSQAAAHMAEVGRWEVFETSYESTKQYANAFNEVEVNVVFNQGDKQWVIPAFWTGDSKWAVRFAPPMEGTYKYHVECTDKSNSDLNGHEQMLRAVAYKGHNPLLKHGFLKIGDDKRHFEHADGTPFFWLGDTWWKGLCKRLTWEGFQELTADRRAKGFSVVQIVCGVFPDEGQFEPRWENEGGKPYLTRNFTVVNPKYFDYADRRIKHLVDAGIVPAIVGGWGRSDCDSIKMAGVAGIKRHWRNLVARYGAYPTVWIIGGESAGPEWTEVARYVQKLDAYHRPSTIHPGRSARDSVTDETVINFDMLQTGHGDWDAARGAIPQIRNAYARKPIMPALIGECCYEGHMQTAFQDVQRYIFWGSMLSGAAGHTYGAAGIWHMGVEGDPGITPIYDFTTWREGMNATGSTQLGLAKKLLEQYPWARFQPHPEWVEAGSFAAGIPGEVRFVYLPRRGVYNWTGPVLRGLERGVPYFGFYSNPTNGKRYDLGTFLNAGPQPKPFEGHTQPLLFEDRFQSAESSDWKDFGTPTQRKENHLLGGKGLVTILDKFNDTNLMASADANSDAEAGIILRFHDADNYLVGLYSPSLKTIFLHDRKNGRWGESLGQVSVPEIGPKIHLTMAATGEYAAMILTDGKKSYSTPVVKINNVTSGKSGLWFYQIGNRQAFGNFELSRTTFAPVKHEINGHKEHLISSDEFRAPALPSPQDWVLVLQREKL